MSHEQKYRYFLNLNVTGKPVDPDHISYVKQLLFISRQNKKMIEKEAKKIHKKCQEEIEYGKN